MSYNYRDAFNHCHSCPLLPLKAMKVGIELSSVCLSFYPIRLNNLSQFEGFMFKSVMLAVLVDLSGPCAGFFRLKAEVDEALQEPWLLNLLLGRSKKATVSRLCFIAQ